MKSYFCGLEKRGVERSHEGINLWTGIPTLFSGEKYVTQKMAACVKCYIYAYAHYTCTVSVFGRKLSQRVRLNAAFRLSVCFIWRRVCFIVVLRGVSVSEMISGVRAFWLPDTFSFKLHFCVFS